MTMVLPTEGVIALTASSRRTRFTIEPCGASRLEYTAWFQGFGKQAKGDRRRGFARGFRNGEMAEWLKALPC